MRIERMTTNQIKVILTADDLDDLNLSVEKLTPNSGELHSFLFKLMEQVKAETGFNPYNGQIMVEATPSLDGVTLLVTRVGDVIKVDKKNKLKIKNVRAVKKRPVRKTGIYCFGSFEDFCGAVKLLDNEIFEKSILYKMDGKYYFVISTTQTFDKYHCAISEFCESHFFPQLYENVLREHSVLIAQYDELVNMVKEIKKIY